MSSNSISTGPGSPGWFVRGMHMYSATSWQPSWSTTLQPLKPRLQNGYDNAALSSHHHLWPAQTVHLQPEKMKFKAIWKKTEKHGNFQLISLMSTFRASIISDQVNLAGYLKNMRQNRASSSIQTNFWQLKSAFDAFNLMVFSSFSSTRKPWSCSAIAFRKAKERYLEMDHQETNVAQTMTWDTV